MILKNVEFKILVNKHSQSLMVTTRSVGLMGVVIMANLIILVFLMHLSCLNLKVTQLWLALFLIIPQDY